MKHTFCVYINIHFIQVRIQLKIIIHTKRTDYMTNNQEKKKKLRTQETNLD